MSKKKNKQKNRVQLNIPARKNTLTARVEQLDRRR